MKYEFCPGDCEYLSVTEDLQVILMKKGIHKGHWCTKYNEQVYHMMAHPLIYKCGQCYNTSKEN